MVTVNKGLRVHQSQSSFLTTNELDIRDDDTASKNLRLLVVTQPRLGRLELAGQPNKRVDAFAYDDLVSRRVKYVHDESELARAAAHSPFESIANTDDRIDLKISDGKNEATTVLSIDILRPQSASHLPVLTSTYSLKCRELQRKQIGPDEIRIVDADTPDDQLRVIITHPAQYGTLEKMQLGSQQQQAKAGGGELASPIEDKLISIDTNTNQKLNLILKFTNNNTVSADRPTFVTVSEFTMAELSAGLIYYNHRGPGGRPDRFGFVVYDGSNKAFATENGQPVSDYQIFNIFVETAKNAPPVIQTNTGLDYLSEVDGRPGRLITKNELFVSDEDDSAEDVFVEITRKPAHGFIEHRDQRGLPVYRFTQDDVNSNKVAYVLAKYEEGAAVPHEDLFEFDVRDSSSNLIRGNRLQIAWSAVSFEERELSVLESEGKVRVHIHRAGNLRRFSAVTCHTVSDTAKSSRDAKAYDFVHTSVRVEFNEDESSKACDVVLNRDQVAEGVESFYVVLAEAKYSVVVGALARVKVNILDGAREVTVEFEEARHQAREWDKFVSLPIVRSGGDLSADVLVECVTRRDETAVADVPATPRASRPPLVQRVTQVKIPSGEMYGFCDVEIVHDDVSEATGAAFKAVLVNPSVGVRIGQRSESTVFIIGPNDGNFIEINE